MTTPPPFNCLTPMGFVAGGKKYEVASIATVQHGTHTHVDRIRKKFTSLIWGLG